MNKTNKYSWLTFIPDVYKRQSIGNITLYLYDEKASPNVAAIVEKNKNK